MEKTISTTDLKAKLDRKEGIKVVETLAPERYREAHIPGALNIPPERIKELAPHLLPLTPDTIHGLENGTLRPIVGKELPLAEAGRAASTSKGPRVYLLRLQTMITNDQRSRSAAATTSARPYRQGVARSRSRHAPVLDLQLCLFPPSRCRT